MIAHDVQLRIGSLLFEDVDQIDLTGPFEVLSRIPNSTYRIYAKTMEPVRDLKGLRLTPDATLAEAPPLDVRHVPGGFGPEALMEDAEVLGWIRQQAAGACSIFSVCTGALLCGAAGLLKGRRATTRHGRSSSTWPMRRSRRSTVARRRPRRPRSCNKHGRRRARSRRSAKRPRAAWRPGWASSCRRLRRQANCPARSCSWRRRRPCPR